MRDLFSVAQGIPMTRGSVYVFELSGNVGLRFAEEIAERLRQALAGHDRIAVSTAAISAADITTIQLLLSAHRQALALGKSLVLAAPPIGVLRDTLVQLGLIDAGGLALSADADFWTRSPSAAGGKAT